jgi:hypothetical protein
MNTDTAFIDTMKDADIFAMLDELARMQAELVALRKEDGIDLLEEHIERLSKAIKAAVLDFGAPVKASVLQAVINKGRESWDGKLLSGFAMAYPEILAARKVGEPTCAIRKV